MLLSMLPAWQSLWQRFSPTSLMKGMSIGPAETYVSFNLENYTTLLSSPTWKDETEAKLSAKLQCEKAHSPEYLLFGLFCFVEWSVGTLQSHY